MPDTSLPEHPDATKRRLREQGDWTEAEELFQSAYNYIRHKLNKASGKTTMSLAERVEANEYAWRQTYSRFPVPADAVPLKSLAEYLNGNSGGRLRVKKKLPELTTEEQERFDTIEDADDHVGEVLWVYGNLDNFQVKALECPSRGAWFMLSHARRDKGWFYEKMYRPVAQQLSKMKAAAGDDAYKASKAEKMALAELDQMILEAVAASQI